MISPSLSAETLSHAVQEALSSHPDLLSSKAQLRGSEADLSAAKGVYLPTLDLTYAKGNETTDSPATRLATGGEVDLDRKEAGLVLRQNLFDVSRFNEVDRAEAARDSSRQGAEATEEKVRFNVIKNFLSVNSNRLIVEVAKSSLAAHEKISAMVSQRSESGAGSQTDTRQAESRLAMARVNYLQYQTLMKNSEYEYLTAVGQPPELEMIDDLTLPVNDLVDMDYAVSEAVRNHPQIKKAQYDLDVARQEQDAIRGRYYPTVGIEARLNKNENIDGAAGIYDEHSVMLRVNYNLFNGGSDWSRSSSRAAKVNEMQERLEMTRRQISEAVRKAWTSREITTERLKYLTEQAEKTETVRNDYQMQFVLGKRSLLNLLDLEKELLEARRDKIRAEYDRRMADVTLLYAMGRLKSSATGRTL
ncbi:MAG TPA: TolC family outer membrane protein [Gammaproteobacteria bacterium]